MTTGPRHALVQFERDGLLLDLSTGVLCHLNQSAMFVWAGFIDGQSESALAEQLARRYGLPLPTAQAHVSEALALDAVAAEPLPPTPPYLYERTAADAYTLSRNTAPLLSIDARGEFIRLSHPQSVATAELPLVLHAIAPKLMALRGHFVLHASAVLIGSSLVALCGKSGAGKTTTARALVRAGAAPVCEDKLVIRSQPDRIDGFIHGESRIKGWVAEAVPALADGRTATCSALDQAADGESSALTAVGFLAADRRDGSTIVTKPLGHSQAASALFGNAFHGSDLAEDWRQHLEIAARAARSIAAYDLVVPAGLERLLVAAADVTRRGGLG
jgi:hypothetical protein